MSGTSPQRQALLAAVADYLLEHGLANLSLRPLALATGTSARMLVYHFGSKEGLIAEAMAEIRARQQALTEAWFRRHPAGRATDLLQVAWSWIVAPAHEPYLRLFLEVLGQGTRQAAPFATFARSTFEDWVTWVRRRLEDAGRPADAAAALAILNVSMLRGLAIYYVATKDKRGATLALNAFIQLSTMRQGA
jgi:AcrR family transcriptional regulator